MALIAAGLYLFIIALYFPWTKRCIKVTRNLLGIELVSFVSKSVIFSLSLFVCLFVSFAHLFLPFLHPPLKGRNSTRAGVFLPHSFPWRSKQKGARKLFVGEFSHAKTPIFLWLYQFLRRKELDVYCYTLDEIVVHQNNAPLIPSF